MEQRLSRRAFLFGHSSLEKDQRLDLGDEEGATAIEYGLIGGLIALAIIPAVASLGEQTEEPLDCAMRTMRRARRGRTNPHRCARN